MAEVKRMLGPDDLAFGVGQHDAIARARGLLEVLDLPDCDSLAKEARISTLARSISAAQQAILSRVFLSHSRQ